MNRSKVSDQSFKLIMNNNTSSGNIISILKQKMQDSKDEITKNKEHIIELDQQIQVNFPFLYLKSSVVTILDIK